MSVEATGRPTCPLCSALRDPHIPPLLETDETVVIEPLRALAEVHVLVVSRAHHTSLSEMINDSPVTAGAMLVAGQVMTERLGIGQSGFRFVFNSGPATNQTITHPHLHVLGGERLSDTIGA